MNIYRISAEGYAMYLFRVAARTQAAACMKLSVLLGIAAENCRVMETLPLNDHVREIESCRTRDDMLDGPEELYTLDAYSRLSNYFGDTEGTRLVGGSFAHYSRCGTVVRRFL